MKICIKGTVKEIAALLLEIVKQPEKLELKSSDTGTEINHAGDYGKCTTPDRR